MERAINSKLGNLISLLGSDVNQLDNLKKSKEKKACLTSRNLTFPFLKIIYYLIFVLGLHCCEDFSLVAVGRLLIVVASLAEEHGL